MEKYVHEKSDDVPLVFWSYCYIKYTKSVVLYGEQLEFYFCIKN